MRHSGKSVQNMGSRIGTVRAKHRLAPQTPFIRIGLGLTLLLAAGLRFYRLAGQSYLFYEEALERIHLSRAFTCYQMVALLRQTPSSPLPTLILDLLTTFADESVSDQEADYLVRQCEGHLQRLSRAAPVVVSAHAHANREGLLRMVEDGADVVLCLEGKSTAPAVQGMMF